MEGSRAVSCVPNVSCASKRTALRMASLYQLGFIHLTVIKVLLL